MNKKSKKKLKIAVIGASYLQKPLVEKAIKNNFEVICFAWQKGAVCKNYCSKFYPISILEKEKILEICQKEKINGVLTIASDLAVITVNYVAHHMNLIANPIESTEYCTNKYLMRKRLSERNINVPEFYEGMKELKSFPLIIKPVDSSGSKGISIAKDSTEIDSAINYAKQNSLSGKYIIEEFIHGKEISVETISYDGKHQYITATDKVTSGFPHFVELEHHQPSRFEKNLKDKIKSTTFAALNALEIENGASHTEFLITEDNEIYCIEVGARMGGDFIGSDLVYLSKGYDYLSAVIEIAIGTFQFSEISTMNLFSGVYFASSESLNKVSIFRSEKFKNFIFKSEMSEPNNELQNSNDRFGYFIYQSKSKLALEE